MKTAFLLLPMLLSTASVWGQQNFIELTETDSTVLSGGKSEFPDIIVDSIISIDGEGRYLDRRFVEKDEAGRLTLFGNESYYEGVPAEGEKQGYVYDEQGRLVRLNYYRPEYNQMFLWGYIVYEYGENKKDWNLNTLKSI